MFGTSQLNPVNSPNRSELFAAWLLAFVPAVPVIWVGGVIDPARLVSLSLVLVGGLVLMLRPGATRFNHQSTAVFYFGLAISLVCAAWFGFWFLQTAWFDSAFVEPVLVLRRWTGLMLGISYIYFLTLLSRRTLFIPLTVLGFLLVFNCVYGMYAYVTSSESVLGLGYRADTTWVTGTFGNRNLFSAFIAMSLPIVASAVMAQKHGSTAAKWTINLALLLLAGMAVASSASRLGAGATVLGVSVWLALVDTGIRSRLVSVVVRVIPVLLLLVGAVWFGMVPLLLRFASATESSGRLEAWISVLDFPVFSLLSGIGPGQFAARFPSVQPPVLSTHYYQLHNDWLQFLVEFGAVPGLLCLFVFLALMKGHWPSQPGLIKQGALAGIVAGSLCAFGDFPLHIAGTAMTYALLVGVFLNPALAGEKKTHKSRVRKRRRTARRSTSNFTFGDAIAHLKR